jgi:hypothetical protein
MMSDLGGPRPPRPGLRARTVHRFRELLGMDVGPGHIHPVRWRLVGFSLLLMAMALGFLFSNSLNEGQRIDDRVNANTASQRHTIDQLRVTNERLTKQVRAGCGLYGLIGALPEASQAPSPAPSSTLGQTPAPTSPFGRLLVAGARQAFTDAECPPTPRRPAPSATAGTRPTAPAPTAEPTPAG